MNGLKYYPQRTYERLIGVAAAFLAFVVYAFTASPSIDVIDAGELATVAYTLGIAHPTGYPLFSIVGGVLSHLPLPLRVIHLTNLMAGALCAAAVYFFFRFLVFFLESFTLTSISVGIRGKEGERLRLVIVPAVCGTLLLAFSETFWAQATSVEVYSLHVLFLALLLLIFSRAISQGSPDPLQSRYWYLFAYVLGLAFGNHMTTILLAPAFLFAFFSVHRFGQAAWKKLAGAVPAFLLGLSVYLYLPFRAVGNPVMNWGNPISLERIIWHFSGKQYRIWLFSSTESAARQMQYFIDTLPAEFVYFPLLLAVLGIIKLARERRGLLVFTLLLFFGCVLYSINYDIHDIDSYFLLAYFTVAMWAAMGIAFIAERITIPLRFLAPAAVVLCLVPAVVNYGAENERDFRLVEDYANDLFRTIEPNGIVISYQWDYFVSASNYLQFVEHQRPDVAVIDKELLRRSWYYHQLETRYPEIVRRSRPEIDAFMKELYKFEHDLPYDGGAIEYRYAAVIRSLIERNIGDRPVYMTPEIEQQYVQGLNRIPNGLTLRIYADTAKHPVVSPQFSFTVPEKKSKYVDGILGMYARAYVTTGVYKNFLGERDSALMLADRALALVPNLPEALYLKERVGGK